MSILSTVISAIAPTTRTQPNALELLKADHEEVDGLFKDYELLTEDERAATSDRRELSRRICAALVVHAKIEEDSFYPAARAAGIDDRLLNEAEVEHGSVKDFIAQRA